MRSALSGKVICQDDEVKSGYKLLINDLSTFVKEGF